MKDAARSSTPSKAQILASTFLNNYLCDGQYMRANVAELVGLALYGDEHDMQTANKAIFASLIEQLADSFDPTAVTLYNRAFSQIIHFCRAREWELDKKLA